jgi:hypothetical protein
MLYLPKMPRLAKRVNSGFLKDFTVPQVAKKPYCPESQVWSQALVNANDFDRFKALQWKILTWEVWNFTDCDHRLLSFHWLTNYLL